MIKKIKIEERRNKEVANKKIKVKYKKKKIEKYNKRNF